MRRSGNGVGDLQFWVDTSNDSNNVASGDAKMTISGSGEVGIGTSAPASLLNISSSADDNAEVTVASEQNATLILDSGRDGNDEESRIYLKDAGSIKWQLYKDDSGNNKFQN